MAKVEIEEADLLNLRHIAGVTDAIMKVPAARQQYLRIAKHANPNLSIPEVDAAAPVMAEVQGINKKLDDWTAAQKQAAEDSQKKMDDFLAAQAEKERLATEAGQRRQFEQTWDQQETELRRDGWRDAGLKQVREFAETNGIANLKIAADAFERRNPQPGPVESRPGWNLFTNPTQEDTFVKDQMTAQGNDDSRLDREIAETLAEVRSGY